MSSTGEPQSPRSPRRVPPPPPKPRNVRPLSTTIPSVQPAHLPAVPSKYLMNDIPRGTSRAKLINSLLTPSHSPRSSNPTTTKLQPDVIIGCIMADSRLDDELSVATIEFSDTPKWLQELNQDPHGFPKKIAFGTLWRRVDTDRLDEHGRSEFIRAVTGGHSSLHYAEMLAEFADIDVNVQDKQGRTALHWACTMNLPVMVSLCLSVPECEIGLRDTDGLTAFDLSCRGSGSGSGSGSGANEVIPALFYKSMFEMEEEYPQAALLRVLTVTSEPATDKAVFPGEAIFDPIEARNDLLVHALIDRGIDHTVRNQDGDTALHVAAKVGNVDVATKLLRSGSDVNGMGNGGATPLHYAAEKNMVKALLAWEAKPDIRDNAGMTPLDLAKDPVMMRQELRAAKEKREAAKATLSDAEFKAPTDMGALFQAVPDGGQPPDKGAQNGGQKTGMQLATEGGNLGTTTIPQGQGGRHENIETQLDGHISEDPDPTQRNSYTARTPAEPIQKPEPFSVDTKNESESSESQNNLDYYQQELAKLREANSGLVNTNTNLTTSYKVSYAELATKYEQKREQLVSLAMDHSELQAQFSKLQDGENIILNKLQETDSELSRLREANQLSDAHGQSTFQSEDLHFSSLCLKLFDSLNIWCNQFSSVFIGRKCTHIQRIPDDNARDRIESVMLDDGDVRRMLKDETRRPKVFMAVAMKVIWQHVFTRYLFGLDVSERQKLLSLEKAIAEGGTRKSTNQWRAATLKAIAARPTFGSKCAADAEEIVGMIFQTLGCLLPPPPQNTALALASLRNLLNDAVQLALEMRTHPAEYMMKRSPVPEYDDRGEVINVVPFKASVMQNCETDTASGEEHEAEGATVKIILFPQVVRRGNDDLDDYDNEITVLPMQVLVTRPESNRSTGSPLGNELQRGGVQRLTPITEHTPQASQGTAAAVARVGSTTRMPMIPEQTVRLIGDSAVDGSVQEE